MPANPEPERNPGVILAQDLLREMVLLRQQLANTERAILLHARAMVASSQPPRAGPQNNLLETIAQLLKRLR